MYEMAKLNCICLCLNSDELKSLDTEINFVKDKLGNIIELANETQDTVSKINNDSLTIYRDIYAINLPDIDVPNLKENISNLNAEVKYLILIKNRKRDKIVVI